MILDCQYLLAMMFTRVLRIREWHDNADGTRFMYCSISRRYQYMTLGLQPGHFAVRPGLKGPLCCKIASDLFRSTFWNDENGVESSYPV